MLIEPDTDLSPEQWKLLEFSDPDRVQAFAPLSKQWIERLDSQLMPWCITVDEQAKREKPKQESPETMRSWCAIRC